MIGCKRLLFSIAAAVLGVSASVAEPIEDMLPTPYTAQKLVSGKVRIWGHGAFGKRQDFMETLMRDWEQGFRKIQPQVEFETHLYGTASAIGALGTGAGDIAVMGREIWPNELAAYEELQHHKIEGVNILTGSFDVRNHGYAVVLFVNKQNPVTGLTLKQVDSIFSADHRRGGQAPKTWADLGVTGNFGSRPIHVYGLPIARGFAEYIEDAVFVGSRKWNPDLKEFADKPGSMGGATDGGQMMLDALAKDPDAIGYAGLPYSNDLTKPLALAEHEGGPFVMPTRATVLDHTYPLTRMITAYFNRHPGKAIDPAAREFLKYILSRQAQTDVLRDGGGYLPMISKFADEERAKLN